MKSIRDYRKQMSEQLLSRQDESFVSLKDSGKFKGFIKEDLDVPTWRCSVGDHIIDVIPYLAGENNPNPKIKPGTISYVLILWVHQGIGLTSDSAVCPSRNYGKPCPICEQQKELMDNGAEYKSKEVSDLSPVRKAIYNIVCYDSEKEEKKGVQVWVGSHFNFEKHIIELSRGVRGGRGVLFSDPDDGKSVAFKREGTTQTDTKYLGHRFVDRDYKITDEILEATYCLEDIVEHLSYEEIAQMFYGSSKEAEVVSVEPEKEVTETISLRRSSRFAKEEVPKEEKAVDSKCPAGAVFGEDVDKIDNCNGCKLFDDCLTEFERIEKEKKSRINRRLRS